MKKNLTKTISVILTIIMCSIPTFAHSGRTDSSGGHRDNKNASGLGSYHYHHGYPAHLHVNGVCEYDFDDKTNHSSSSHSTSSHSTSKSSDTDSDNSDTYSVAAIQSDDNSTDNESDFFTVWQLYIIFGAALLIFVFIILSVCVKKWLSKSLFKDSFEQTLYGFDKNTIDRKLSNIQNMINGYKIALKDLQKYSDNINAIQQKNNEILKKIPQNIPIDKNRCVTSADIPGIDTVYITSKNSAMHRYKGCSGAYTEINTADAIKAQHKICLKCFLNPCREELQEINKNKDEIRKLEISQNLRYSQLCIDNKRNDYKNALLEIRNNIMNDIGNIEYLLEESPFCDILKNNLNDDEYDDIPSKDDFMQLCHHMKTLSDVTKQYEKNLQKYKKIILFEGIVIAIFVILALYIIINIALI